MNNFVKLAVSGVQALQPYQPGKPIDELEREYGLSNIIKLASNENPLGSSPRVIEVLQNNLKELTRYPDGNGFDLKQALAKANKYPNITTDNITLGNGSNDVLEMIARAFVNETDSVIYSEHAFAVYPIVTQAIGATAVVTPAKDWGHDLSAMLSAVTEQTKLVFIANPNNPTGTWINTETVQTFLESLPEHVIVVLDEAYFEFASHPNYGVKGYPDGLGLLKQFENLIVTRTFSKAYGLAGLRVGYAIAGSQITNILNRVRQPFNVNSLALKAAEAALADEVYLNASVQLNHEQMKLMEEGLRALNLSFIPSVGNFICFKVANANSCYESLLKKGIIVRPVGNYGMQDYLRVSIGISDENQQFLSALKQVI
ncbi:Biosynthetic Aromatic amino acid aminotransferase beta [hydrothermal vent metagenome]|uniref:Biosynthetic Aromatic amino acid aminotransferase beta n=1 Tax=hydrothermal vent metagenome TaxID=652676 RepID=A0A3B1A742_9ZZZZ